MAGFTATLARCGRIIDRTEPFRERPVSRKESRCLDGTRKMVDWISIASDHLTTFPPSSLLAWGIGGREPPGQR